MPKFYLFPIRLFLSVLALLLSEEMLLAQTSLSAGDIAFVRYVTADDGLGGTQNDEFTFVLLKDITSGTVINFTDYGWTSSNKFQETFGSTNCGTGNFGSKTDGVVSWSATTGYSAGQQITIKCKYAPSASVGVATGVTTSYGQTYYMSLSIGGDQLFAYQGTFASPAFLAGISLNQSWASSLTPCLFTSSQSILPAALSSSNVAITNSNSDAFSAYYQCTTSSANASTLLSAINTVANWTTNNNDNSDASLPIPAAFLSPQCSFTVLVTQITASPASATVCAGQGATFAVTATNASSYQWQLFNGSSWNNLSNTTPYSGVTSATLTISNATGLNGNQYRAIANGASSATSTAATLTVGTAPQSLSLTPSGPLNCINPSITLTAASTGGISYTFSGPGILSTTSNTATVNQPGTYTVVATSTAGCSASTTATVTNNVTSPTPGLTNNGPLTCSIASVTLTASGGSSYAFSTGATPFGDGTQATVSTSGVYSVTVTDANGCTATTTTTVNGSTTPPTPGLTNNGPLTCSINSVTLTASGGSSYAFSTGATPFGDGTQATVTTSGVYSVTVTDANGCTATTSTTVNSNTLIVATASASATTVQVGSAFSLSATGGSSYLWTAPTAGIVGSPANTSVVSATVTDTGDQTFSVLVTQGSCSQSLTVVVTGSNGPDLTASMNYPDASFPNTLGSSKDFVVNLFEVGGLPTSAGTVTITLTAPLGYTLSFNGEVSSINVSGGNNNPVSINNTNWSVTNDQGGQQLTLTMKSGINILGGGKSLIGFTMTRTLANPNSTSNITVNVSDDTGHSYDVNAANNIFARIIMGL